MRTIAISLLCPVMLAAAYGLDPDVHWQLKEAAILLTTADTGQVRDYLRGFGWWAPLISTALQLVTALVAPLPSFLIVLANAMLYGALWGALLTWTSGLLAGAMCFAISRACGRGVVERLVPRSALAATDAFFDRRGARAVVVGRVLPFINPDLVSYVAGLTGMGWRPFLAGVAVGSLPSTLLYSYLGSRGTTSVGMLLLPLLLIGGVASVIALLHHYRVSDGTRAGSATLGAGR